MISSRSFVLAFAFPQNPMNYFVILNPIEESLSPPHNFFIDLLYFLLDFILDSLSMFYLWLWFRAFSWQLIWFDFEFTKIKASAASFGLRYFHLYSWITMGLGSKPFFLEAHPGGYQWIDSRWWCRIALQAQVFSKWTYLGFWILPWISTYSFDWC